MLEGFIATSLTYSRDDHSDFSEGHEQKLYLDKLITLLPLGHDQRISVVRHFFDEWCSTDFSVDVFIVILNGIFKNTLSEQKCKEETYIPSTHRRLISVA